MARRAAFVSIVDDADDDDIDHITSYCEKCKSWGFPNEKLGPRVYPKDQPLPYDHDLWRQCMRCGDIVAAVHLKHKNEIEGIKSVPDTIHDSGKVVALSFNGRSATSRRARAIIDQIRKTRPGANRQNNYYVDMDVRNASNTGKKLISYSSTNDEFKG